MRTSLLALLTVGALAGCADETSLLVEVTSPDLVVPDDVDALRFQVAGESGSMLDQTLSNRVIEFEVGSATLTPAGVAIVDEMAQAIGRLGAPRIQIIGHTDSSGERMSNVVLSLSRANSVRDYLVSKGLPGEMLSALGAGPDRPLASNDTPEGRAKNRRIEFRLAN